MSTTLFSDDLIKLSILSFILNYENCKMFEIIDKLLKVKVVY